MQERGDSAREYSHNAGKGITHNLFFYALAASFIWHLFWILSVKVFVAPAKINKGISSSVSFIGAILEEGSIYTAIKPQAGIDNKKEESRQPVLTSEIITKTASAIANDKVYLPESSFDMFREMELKLPARYELMGAKQIPLRQFDKVRVSYKTFPSEITGPARYRQIVYKPDLPAYLKWDEGLGVDLDRVGDSFEMELKFWVSPEGKVGLVERVSSSGHPAIDLIGIRYIKGWQFAPLASGQSKDEQWGIIKLNFSLTRAEAR